MHAASKSRVRVAAAAIFAIALSVFGYFALFADERAPEVEFRTLGGETIATSDLRGKVVLVNFWSTDCVTCIKEMPHMVETWNKYNARGFEMVAVAMKYDPPNYVLAYAEKNRLPFKVALDISGDAARRFGEIRLTPTSFLIDRRGNVVKRYLGEPDFAQLHALVEEKLRDPAS
jgi:peroxiredoxin